MNSLFLYDLSFVLSEIYFFIYDVDADTNLNEAPIAYDAGSYSLELLPNQNDNLNYIDLDQDQTSTSIDDIGFVEVYMYTYPLFMSQKIYHL